MEFEDWLKIGIYLKKARTLIFKGADLDRRPKTQTQKWDRAIRHIDKARSLLEDLLFIEYPERDNLFDVFYGERDREA